MMRMLSLTLTVLLAVPAAAGWEETSRLTKTYREPVAGDAMGVTVHRLANGLTVYLSPNTLEPRIASKIAVRAGSKHDPDDSTGMAHYLEHMLFKGSQDLGTLDFAKEKPHLERMKELYEELFTTLGPQKRAEIYKAIDHENIEAAKFAIPNEFDKLYKKWGFKGINAYTWKEYTVYIANLPQNRLEQWAELEANRFSKPVFRLFQSEIEAVYEEKNRSEDNASRILSRAYEDLIYKGHPYARTTLGSVEHLKNPSLAKMYKFFETYYRPNNMAIILSGDFERAKALEVLRRHFGSWVPADLPSPDRPAPQELKGVERVEVSYEAEEQVLVGWRTAKNADADRYALTVLDMLMDNSTAGIINLELNQKQAVKRAGSYPSFWNDLGLWTMWGLPKEGQTLEQVEALLLQTVQKLKDGAFSEADLKAVVTDFEVSQKSRLESNDERASIMEEAFLQYRDWEEQAAFLERVRAVTKDDVVRVAKKYLGEDRVVAYRRKGEPTIPKMAKPEFTKITLEPGRESAFAKTLAAMKVEPIEPRWVEKGRDYRVVDAKWGRLITAPNPMNDLFQYSLTMHQGSEHDPALCYAADMWDLSGGAGMDAEAFKKKLYALGSKISVSCGAREISFSAYGLEENFEETMNLLWARVENPVVAEDVVPKMIEVEKGRRKDNKVNTEYVQYALGEWAKRGKESHVLRDLPGKELDALSADTLKAKLKRVWEMERDAWFTGNLKDDLVVAMGRGGRGVWAKAPKREPLTYVAPDASRVLFVNKDMAQAQVGIFAPDEVYDPRHAVDYSYWQDYMGGGMSAVIFQEVREARALAYSAYGRYGRGEHAGDANFVYGFVGTQADKTVEAVSLLYSLLRKLPPSEERFAESKRAMLERYRSMPIHFRHIAGSVQNWLDLGYKGDPRPKNMREAASYTLKKLTRFAARFEDKPMTVYVLGSRDRVNVEGLKGLGRIEELALDDLYPY